jgi:hypothetical protein
VLPRRAGSAPQVNPDSLLVLGLAVSEVGKSPVLIVMGVLTAVSVGTITLLSRPVRRTERFSRPGRRARTKAR